jgi:hypothetical protein
LNQQRNNYSAQDSGEGKEEEEKQSFTQGSRNSDEDEEEDDLPPLEEKPPGEKVPVTPDTFYRDTAKDGVVSSSSEDEGGKVAYYTNLEELD